MEFSNIIDNIIYYTIYYTNYYKNFPKFQKDILNYFFEYKNISNEELLDLLNNFSYDINETCEKGGTILMYALMFKNHKSIINRILDLNPDVNKANINGTTTLMYALENYYQEIVNKLLDLNADINAIDKIIKVYL